MTGKTKSFQIKKILCPTDFSAESDAAIRYSANLAEAYSAKLYVCHHKSHSWWKPEQSDDANIERIERKITPLITEISDKIIWQNVVIERSGNTAQCITDFADTIDSDLIVLSARHSTFSAPLFGSTLERIISASACPVLILPADFKGNKNRLNIRRILLNYDFNPASETIFEYALSFAQKFDSEFHLLHIIQPAEKTGTELSQSPEATRIAENRIREKLLEIASEYKNYQIIPALKMGKWQKELVDYANWKNIDLICTIAPPKKFYLEHFFPVWLRQMLENASTPLLISRHSAAKSTKPSKEATPYSEESIIFHMEDHS